MHTKNAKYPDAVAYLKGGEYAPHLSGKVKFYQRRGRVFVEIHVSGLPQDSAGRFFALHLHEGESCQGQGFSDTYGHYNPTKTLHPRHAGDLPPLLSCQGDAYLAVLTDRFCVQEILGRTVVIHSGTDDFTSQPAGNAGSKIACGVICRC